MIDCGKILKRIIVPWRDRKLGRTFIDRLRIVYDFEITNQYSYISDKKMINQAFSRPFFNAFYLNRTFLFWTRQLKSLSVFFAIKLKVQNADFSCSQTLLIFSGNLTYEDTANSITYNLVPFVFLIIAFFLFRICKYILSDIFANHLKMFHLNFHAKNKIDFKYFNFRAQKHP